MQVGQSCLSEASEASHQLHIENLSSVLVLHLKRLVYDTAADDIVKDSKPIQFLPELEFPLGTIFFFVCIMLVKAKNPSCLCRHRNHGARCREICEAGALQALWGALPPRHLGVRRQRALFGRRAPPELEWRQRQWGSLAAH